MSSIKRSKSDVLRKAILVDNVKKLEKDLRSDPKITFPGFKMHCTLEQAPVKLQPKTSVLDDETHENHFNFIVHRIFDSRAMRERSGQILGVSR